MWAMHNELRTIIDNDSARFTRLPDDIGRTLPFNITAREFSIFKREI